MIVPPCPVRLLVVILLLGKIAVFAMVIFCVHVIGPIFVRIPLMIVICSFCRGKCETSNFPLAAPLGPPIL